MGDSNIPEAELPGSADALAGLSHLRTGPDGLESRMVDVSAKPATAREALAAARVRFPSGVLDVVLAGGGPKGPVTEVARVAGVMAAKRTGEWIPMCHPLALDFVEIRFERVVDEPDCLEVRCRTACTGRTGVEMEALVGASAAALTVYDMTKALSKGIRIETVRLLEKRGGKSGVWTADSAD
jgi:cyclic pyranopterin phosphate synthase